MAKKKTAKLVLGMSEYGSKEFMEGVVVGLVIGLLLAMFVL
jgi:F0F1-type ATP synthase assembly protein I